MLSASDHREQEQPTSPPQLRLAASRLPGAHDSGVITQTDTDALMQKALAAGA